MAVYRHEIEELARFAPTLLAIHPPIEAMRRWLARAASYGQVRSGVRELIHAASTESVEGEACALVIGAIEQLLDAGTAAGRLRQCIEPTTSCC